MSDKIEIDSLDEHIAKAMEMAMYILKASIKMDPVKKLAKELEAIFPQFYHAWGDTGTHYVKFNCKSIEEVTPILRYVTKVGGLHQVGEKKQQGLNCIWNFPQLEIEVGFSGKCRMVQTGTKTVEIPIMEMKCEEEAAPLPENPPDEIETHNNEEVF